MFVTYVYILFAIHRL